MHSDAFMSPVSSCPLVYLVYREGLSSVFESQMLTPMRAVAQSGVPVTLVAFAAIGEFFRSNPRKKWHNIFQCLETSTPLRLQRLPGSPTRWPTLWNEAAVLRCFLRARFPGQRVLLHAAGDTAADLARQSSSVRLIFNVFGLWHAELLHERGYENEDEAPDVLRQETRRRKEQLLRCAGAADHLITVSHELARFLVEFCKINPEDVTIIPCCVNTDRFVWKPECREQVRHLLGLRDRFVITYCGSYHRWQCPHESARLFLRFRTACSDAHYLVLSQQPERLKKAALEAGVPAEAVTSLSVPHTEVPKYLCASDAALLIRRPSLVNRVASPVKFAEYLAVGLPVILTDHIGDYSAAARNHNLGLVIPFENVEDYPLEDLARFARDVRTSSEAWRSRCCEFAKQHLSWKANLPVLLTVYENVMRSRSSPHP